jgi:hypothetical protein
VIDTGYMKAGTVLIDANNEEVFYVCDYPDNPSKVIINSQGKGHRPILAVLDKSDLKVKPLIKRITINIYRKDDVDTVYSYNSYEASVIGREMMKCALTEGWRFIGTYGIDTPI